MFFLLTWRTLAYVSSNYKHLERTIWYHYPAQPFLCMQPLCRAFIRSRLPLELWLRFRAQSAFKIFDPVAVPPKSDQSFSENGDKEISSGSDSAQILWALLRRISERNVYLMGEMVKSEVVKKAQHASFMGLLIDEWILPRESRLCHSSDMLTKISMKWKQISLLWMKF